MNSLVDPALILMVVGLALLEAANKQRLASAQRGLRTAAVVSLALSLMAIAFYSIPSLRG
jgi:hypothetical protein